MKKARIVKWKRRIAFVLSLALMVTMLPDAWPGTAAMAAQTEEEAGGEVTLEGDNVAPYAAAEANYSNTGTDPKNVNNGYLAGAAGTTWNTWKQGGLTDPAQILLKWKVNYELDGMRVVWWADNNDLTGSGGVTFPKSCIVEYLNEKGNWVKITGMTNENSQTVDGVGVLYNTSDGNGLNGANKQWNTVKFPSRIKTKGLRLSITRSGTGDNGLGISEWEAYGTKKPDANDKVNIAGDATAVADYSAGGGAAKVNDGKLSEGDGSTVWHTWKEGGSPSPCNIKLQWKRKRTLSSMKVMWWIDDVEVGTSGNDGILVPELCEVKYKDDSGKWQKITDMTDESGKATDTMGVKIGSAESAVTPDNGAESYKKGGNRYWNEVKFAQEIQAKEIQLSITKKKGGTGGYGVGIGEWEVYGDYEDDPIVSGVNIAAKAKASADYFNSSTPGCSVDNVNNMALADGNGGTTWNTYCNDGNLTYPQPITLTWEEPYDISGMRVMWWADDLEPGTSGGGDGVLFPGKCQAYYFDYENNGWTEITSMENEAGETVSTVGVSGNKKGKDNRTWNGVAFTKPIKTTQLKLLIDRPDKATSKSGIGIGEWEVYGKEIRNDFVGAKITGKKQLLTTEESELHAVSIPDKMSGGFTYKWSVPEKYKDSIQIQGNADQEDVIIKALKIGTAAVQVEMTLGDVKRIATHEVTIEEPTGIEEYVTTTTPGKAPILPDTVAVKGVVFDDPTPSTHSTHQATVNYDFAEQFNSKLMKVTWNNVPDASAYDEVGKEVVIKGTVPYTDKEAVARVTVKKAAEIAVENSTVTFENVKLTDEFWLPKQKINALNSLNKAIKQIGLASGGEPNFDNAIKKLNGEPYDPFSGLVFQDSDIYKTLEAISYTLSVINMRRMMLKSQHRKQILKQCWNAGSQRLKRFSMQMVTSIPTLHCVPRFTKEEGLLEPTVGEI